MSVTHEPSSTSDREVLALETILSRIAVELSAASDDIKGMQDTIEDLVECGLSSAGMVRLQGLDLVEQTVRAIGEIVASLSVRKLDGLVVPSDEILATCKLSALADRLAGVVRDDHTDFELF